jgi:hypothetical protein
MTDTGTEEAGLNGVLRLTRVTDHLEHVLAHNQLDEPSGTWTGLACPDHGLAIGADVDNAALQGLARHEIADLVWEAPPEFTAEHGQVSRAAILAHQAGDLGGKNSGNAPRLCGPAPGQPTTKHLYSCNAQAWPAFRRTSRSAGWSPPSSITAARTGWLTPTFTTSSSPP